MMLPTGRAPADRSAIITALRTGDRPDLAAALCRDALAGEPNAADLHHYLGAALERAERLDEAEAAFRRALELQPDADSTARLLGVLLLSQGRLGEGFAFFEARHALSNMAKPRLPFPEWRGEPMKGKRLAIWPEQGFGDQIQFSRFAPLLAQQGAEVTLFCRPGLERLFSQSFGAGVEVRAAAGAVEFPDPDYWVMSGSLPARLGVTVETIPGQPYLHATARRPGPRIGLMTAGNPAHLNDANRSLSTADASRLLNIVGEAVDLAPAATGARDFADTAGIVAGLDLVISVDTAVAHLAGAMGKPCWVLLPAIGTDWRWLRARVDSPWYPSLRLYRQPGGLGWGPVLDRIAADLVGRL